MITYLRSHGAVTMGTLSGIIALIASIASPILWVGQIKETNAVQDSRLNTIDRETGELRSDVKEISRGMTALLIKNGINPNTLNDKTRTQFTSTRQ